MGLYYVYVLIFYQDSVDHLTGALFFATNPQYHHGPDRLPGLPILWHLHAQFFDHAGQPSCATQHVGR